MCEKLGIARASYYKWLNRTIPEQEIEDRKLVELIIEYDGRFGHILGYRRMTAWINHFNGTNYSRKHVHYIMKELGIHAQIRKKRKTYLYSNSEEVAENLLKRDFNSEKPNEKWATDVTEFKIPNSDKKIFLSAILDLYDKSVVSWEIAKRNDNALVFKTFDQAIADNSDVKPLFHSDRGFQYTSKVFKLKLESQGMAQSMSRVGHCIDNGPTEGFWGILKTEMYAMYEITNEESLIDAIYKYIDFYNNERLQERFGFKTPAEIRFAALASDSPEQYLIPENKRIQKYKAKFAA